MIEIPSKFADQPPVNPDAKLLLQEEWPGYTGLTDDVKYYGEWMKNEAVKRIGHLYPRAKDKHGKEHTVIAWIWARTVKCPNPACGCEMPLVNNFTLSRKKNKNIYVEPYEGFVYPSKSEKVILKLREQLLVEKVQNVYVVIRQSILHIYEMKVLQTV